jgi:hypothetical protein
MPNGVPEALTFVEDADATVPPATSVAVVPSNQGKAPGLVLGYVDGAGDFQILGSVDGIPVTGDTTLVDMEAGTFNTPVSIPDAAASTELIAANADRRGWTIQNMSDADLYVRVDGGTAALGSCHRVLRKYEHMGQKVMDGDLSLTAITGRWASDAGGTAVGGDWE